MLRPRSSACSTILRSAPRWDRRGRGSCGGNGGGGRGETAAGGLGREGVRFLFLPARGGRVGAALDGILPTSLVSSSDLEHAIAGAHVVHSIAREWAGPLERVARASGAAFVETPLVHPGQRFSGTSAADVARYRRDDAVIALTKWESEWYASRRVRHAHVTGVGPIIDWLPEVPMDPATVLFVGRKERYKGYHALRDAAKIVWRSRPEARFVAIGQNAWTARFERRLQDGRRGGPGVLGEAE